MVPGGHRILDTIPCLVLGQEMSIITRGLQYSTPMLGSLEDGGLRSSSSGTAPSDGVWAGAAIVDVVRGHGATAVVVAGIFVVVVLDVVVVMVTVVGRVVVLVVMVVVSGYIMTEDEVSGGRGGQEKVNSQTQDQKKGSGGKKIESECLSFFSHTSFMSKGGNLFWCWEKKKKKRKKEKRTKRTQKGYILPCFLSGTLGQDSSKRINWNRQV